MPQNEEKQPFQHPGTLECFNNGGLSSRYFKYFENDKQTVQLKMDDFVALVPFLWHSHHIYEITLQQSWVPMRNNEPPVL